MVRRRRRRRLRRPRSRSRRERREAAIAKAKSEARKNGIAKALVEKPNLFTLDWQDLVAKGVFQALEKSANIDAADDGDTVLIAAPSDLAKFAQETGAVLDFVARFMQQAPLQTTTKAHGRAVGPIKSSLDFASELKLNLRKCFRSGQEEAAVEAQIGLATSTYWNMPGMQITYMEKSLRGCVRYQMHGESELLLLPIAASVQTWGGSRHVQECVREGQAVERGRVGEHIQ